MFLLCFPVPRSVISFEFLYNGTLSNLNETSVKAKIAQEVELRLSPNGTNVGTHVSDIYF